MDLKQKLIRRFTGLMSILCALIFACVVFVSYVVPDEIERAELTAYSDIFGLNFGRGSRSVSVSVPASTPRELSLFGVIPVKTVYLHNQGERRVSLGGMPFGCVLDIEHLLVVGISDVQTKDGMTDPAAKAGIRVGDTLVSCNGISLERASDLAQCVQNSGGSPLQITYERDGQSDSVTITPVYAAHEQCYKLGLWVRDSEAGVGILSFCDEESGVCVGLGHALKDADTGKNFDIDGGSAYLAKILNVEKGTSGSPGQLSGCIQAGQAIGKVISNEDRGVFFLSEETLCKESVEVALPEEVQCGDAELILAMGRDGERPYHIRIEKIRETDSERKNLQIRVVDDELLSLTGGIVQGMSGSPILQNGRIVGVLTHVLVDDPTSGYAIFADSLLTRARSLPETEFDHAS